MMMQPGMQAGIGMGPQRPPQGPPQGGPMMPPPQPGMAGPQGADPMAMMEQLKNAPDQQLQQMVQSKHPLGSFALVMLNGRNQARKAAQAQQMQQVANQPPVAQRVMQEAQQMGGIAALPTGQAVPPQFADGGIVGPTAEEEYARLTDPRILVGGVERLKRALYGTDASRSGYETAEGDALAAMYNTPESPAQAIAVNRPPVSPAYEERVPVNINNMNRAYSATVPAARSAPTPPAAPPAQRPGAGASSGIASLTTARNPSEQLPPWKSPLEGAPAAFMSDEQWLALALKKRDEMSALYGPSYADKYLKELMAEREQLKAREPRARDEAWLTAGLRMMQGKSRHGLQNIGAGGEAGIAQYRADRTQTDEQARALRREMMGLEASEQQRRDAMMQAGMGRADKREAQMGQARAEYIGVKEKEMEYNAKNPELAIKSRQADADMLRANAAMKAAGAAAAANHDARMSTALNAGYVAIERAVEKRLEEQTLVPAAKKLSRGQIHEQELNTYKSMNPIFTQALRTYSGDGGGGGISARSVGLAKKP